MTALIGLTATAVSLFATVPQVLRAWRTRDAQGLSWGSLMLSLLTVMLWGIYGLSIGDRVQILNNGLALLLIGALAVVVVRVGAPVRVAPSVALLAAATGAALLAVGLIGPMAVAMVGTVIGCAQKLPQTRMALARVPLWGLCPWATVLGQIGPALWLAYGVAAGDPAVMIASFLGLVLQTVIVAYRLPPRRTLHSLAGGRLGPLVARTLSPLAARLPLPA